MGLEMLRFEGHVEGHVQFGLTVKQNISDFIFFLSTLWFPWIQDIYKSNNR